MNENKRTYFLFVHANSKLIQLAKADTPNLTDDLLPELLLEWCSPAAVGEGESRFNEVLAREYVRMLQDNDIDSWRAYLTELRTESLGELALTPEFERVSGWMGVQQFQWRIDSLAAKLEELRTELREQKRAIYQHLGDGIPTNLELAVQNFQERYPALTDTMVERCMLMLTQLIASYAREQELSEVVVLGGNRVDSSGHNTPIGGELARAFILFAVQQQELQEVLRELGIESTEFEQALIDSIHTESEVRQKLGFDTQLSATTSENIALLNEYASTLRSDIYLVSSPEHYARIEAYLDELNPELKSRLRVVLPQPTSFPELQLQWRSLPQLVRDHANELAGELLGQAKGLNQLVQGKVAEMRSPR